MNSSAYSTNCRRRGDERGLGLFLHDGQESVEILDSFFGQVNRRHNSLIRGCNSLTQLLHVNANRRRDVVHVVCDRARVPHDRIDVTINAIHHVADLPVALPEIPRRRHKRDRQHTQSDGSDSTRISGDLLEQSRLDCHLLRDDRVGQGPGNLL